MTALKLILKIVIAPVILLLTLAIWICVGLVYISGLVLGLLSTVIALLGVAVLVTYSPQNGLIIASSHSCFPLRFFTLFTWCISSGTLVFPHSSHTRADSLRLHHLRPLYPLQLQMLR